MKNSFSIETYACTFLLRTFWSILIVLTAIVGLHIVTSNATGNDYHMQKANQSFEILYFSITAALEVLAAIFYALLWVRQRGRDNLQSINTCDCRSTCLFILVRLGWTIALSVLVLLQADHFKHVRPHNGESMSRDTRRGKEWGVIQTVTLLVMIFEVTYIIGIVCGLLYQPDDFQREIHFDSLQNIISDGNTGGNSSSVAPNRAGIIPENHAMKQIEEMRRTKLQQKIDNLNRLKRVRENQRFNHLKHMKGSQATDVFQFKSHNQRSTEKRFMRNFKDVDDNNINGRAENMDEAYQQFLDFKAKKQEQEELTKGLGKSKGSRSQLLGRTGTRVLDEYNCNRQAADVLGGNQGPAHEELASHGRQSSLSSRHNNDLDLQSPQLSSQQIGHAAAGPGPRPDDGIEMAGEMQPKEVDILDNEPYAEEKDKGEYQLNSIEDIMEPPLGTAIDMSEDNHGQNDTKFQHKSDHIYVSDQMDSQLAEPPRFNDQVPDHHAYNQEAVDFANQQPSSFGAFNDGVTPQGRSSQLPGPPQQEDVDKFDHGAGQ